MVLWSFSFWNATFKNLNLYQFPQYSITIDISKIWDTTSHHSQLVSHATQSFNTLLHGNKFSTKNSAFLCGLLFSHPITHGVINKHNVTGLGTASKLVPSMFRIDKHPKVNILAKRFGSVQWLCIWVIPTPCSQFSLALNSYILISGYTGTSSRWKTTTYHWHRQ